ncbi:MAG: thiopurine S-methyltransferase, partial [Legionellaceae bacterium]|nr:thiopurine S-methyltransferase [Legionellaceae bacterium]
MDNHYWLNKWEKDDIGFNQPKAHPLLVEHFDILKIAASGRIFVPLCGKSIDMLWLLGRGYQVVGIELSEVACKAFFAEHQLSFKVTEHQHIKCYAGEHITLICGDFFELTQETLGSIDAVYDRAALIALPEPMRKRYVAHLLRLIPAHAKALLISLSYNPKEMTGPPFPVL